jgi:hypothetical protein
MKRLSYIIIIVLAGFSMGCTKNLNLVPLNNITVPTFFKTESDIEEFVDGLYTSMVPGQGTPYFDAGSDLNIINSGRTDITHGVFALGNYDATTGDVAAFWDYSSIRNAYIFFQNIGNIPMSDASRALYTGSVDYLLAYRYFVMFRAYGAVPIVRSILTPGNADIASSPADSVFVEALKWADSAAINLPAMGPAQRERGKLTKLVALTLKADMLLFAASRYQQTISGATFQAAADAAQAAITEANADGYGLASNYLDPFIASTQAGADAQKEIIIENVRLSLIAVDAYGLSSYLFRPRYDGEGVDMFLAPQELVDQYECTDGKPINLSPLYDPTHPFSNRDPRLGYSILYPGSIVNRVDGSSSWISNSLDSSAGNADYMLETNNLRDRNSSGYINVKYWDRQNDATTAGYGSYVGYRYAELLLMFAEAQNEATGPGAAVYQALTQVRQRVGMPAVTALTNPTQDSVRALVRNERAVELVGEGKRYFDIIRWGTAGAVLNKSYYSMHIPIFNPNGSLAGYEPSIWVGTNLTDPTQESLFPIPNGATGGNFLIQYSFQSPKGYIWPIPQEYIDQSTTGALKQNPLWQ